MLVLNPSSTLANSRNWTRSYEQGKAVYDHPTFRIASNYGTGRGATVSFLPQTQVGKRPRFLPRRMAHLAYLFYGISQSMSMASKVIFRVLVLVVKAL